MDWILSNNAKGREGSVLLLLGIHFRKSITFQRSVLKHRSFTASAGKTVEYCFCCCVFQINLLHVLF